MSACEAPARRLRVDLGIWGFALGYFLCYVPYSGLTKALSKGMLPGMAHGFGGFELLPVTAMAGLLAMMVYLSAMGWWKHAGQREVLGLRLPMPRTWTLLSGVCTAAIIATTTLAYTFSGISIVFMMLVMRGGVLVLAPLVDWISSRAVRWFSWAALLLSLAALLAASTGAGGRAMTSVAAIDVAVYLSSYFLRLRFMSKLAKSEDPRARLRYFVEEQMVATPFLVVGLALVAWLGGAGIPAQIKAGFTTFLDSGWLIPAILVGLFSQGTGLFGTLIFLDRRENTYCVPVNRASSVLAGLVASYGLVLWLDAGPPPASELVGAALMLAAVLVLSMPELLSRGLAVLGARVPRR